MNRFKQFVLFTLVMFGVVGALFNLSELLDPSMPIETFDSIWYLKCLGLILISLVALLLYLHLERNNDD